MRKHYLFPTTDRCLIDGVRLILLLGTLLSNSGLVWSMADVSFTLNWYSNLENKMRDGTYCNTDQSPCNLKFWFNFEEPIKYTFVTLDMTASSINYTIGPDAITKINYEKIPNPFPADTNTTNIIKKIKFKIYVYHYDASATLHVVALFSLTNLAQFGSTDYIFADGSASFNITAEINCAVNYYGDCSVRCIEGAHYTCDPADGSKVCKQGWKGSDCEIEFAVPCNTTTVQNGTCSPQQTSFNENEQVIVSCNPGFLPLSTTLTCFKNGSWDQPWPTCTVSECKKLNVLVNGTTSPSSASTTTSPVGETVSFSCSAGYLLVGSNNTVCQANATWSNDIPTCKEIRCKKVSTPKDGNVNPATSATTTSDIGSTVRFNCSLGFRINGSSVLTCLTDGSWDYSEPTCDVIKCQKLNVLVNGTTSPSSASTTTSPVGETVSFSCSAGYLLVGSNNTVCQANATWSNDIPTCKEIRCKKVSTPKDGNVNPATSATTTSGIGSTVRFNCSLGFCVNGSSVLTCLTDGNWDYSEPTCDMINCDKITTFKNGTVKYNTEIPFEGSSAEFECDAGLHLVGRSSATCLPNGTWDVAEIPQCMEGCKIHNLIDPSNVTTEPSSYATDVILVGYTLRFSCRHGYYLNSSIYVSCLDDGSWNSSIPFCLSFTKDVSSIVKQVLKSGMIILGGVLAIFVLLVLLLIYIDRRMQKNLIQKVISSKRNASNTSNDTNTVRMSQLAIVTTVQNKSNSTNYSKRADRTKNRYPSESDSDVMAFSNPVFVEDF